MSNEWEYRTVAEWQTILNEWLSTHTPSKQQRLLVDSFKWYVQGLQIRDGSASGRFKYESNGRLNTILHRLNANE